MANEKEVREGCSRDPEPWCSATDSPCQCVSGGGCQALRGGLDPLPKEVVRELRTARLYIQAAKFRLDDILGAEHLRVRQYPAPEAREIRRKLETAIAMIDELGGDL